jgi:hypothetical protein
LIGPISAEGMPGRLNLKRMSALIFRFVTLIKRSESFGGCEWESSITW